MLIRAVQRRAHTVNLYCQLPRRLIFRGALSKRFAMSAAGSVEEEKGGGAATSQSPSGEGESVLVREGKAEILFPSRNEVFYNPVQEFNRDLSIAVIKHYSERLWEPRKARQKRKQAQEQADSSSTAVDGEPGSKATPPAEVEKEEEGEGEMADSSGDSEEEVVTTADEKRKNSSSGLRETAQSDDKPRLSILEALAASGLRSVRYALEVPKAGSVVANDYSRDAYLSICRNVEHNKVGGVVTPSWREASMLMYEHRERQSEMYDVIDLDPYGSPSRFLDATVQAVKDGGLLCITCTDMSVLCGTRSETCHSKYGSTSLKARYCHEMALRIVLASLESHANRYQRHILPLLSVSVDFYVRVIVRVFHSAAEVKRSPSKLAMVYHCIGCESFHLQPIGKRLEDGRSRKYPPGTGPPVDRQCDQCSSLFRLGGPVWAEPLHDADFVSGLLSQVKASPALYRTSERIQGLLTVVSEELPDVPLYYVLDQLCATVHCNSPKMLAVRSAILDQGYRVSLSHANANAIKTDAPHHVIWDIMRCWVQKNPVKSHGANSPATAILSKQPNIAASFVIRPDANPPSRLMKLARFPENPEANWGPKARAKRRKENPEDLPSKRQRLQGKRK